MSSLNHNRPRLRLSYNEHRENNKEHVWVNGGLSLKKRHLKSKKDGDRFKADCLAAIDSGKELPSPSKIVRKRIHRAVKGSSKAHILLWLRTVS